MRIGRHKTEIELASGTNPAATIQEARRDDLNHILALQKACYRQEAEIYGDYEIPPLLQTAESIIADFEHQVFLKLQAGERIIGSVRGQTDNGTCKIGRLIVHEDFQNQGWGTQLMRAIEERFSEVKRYELFTGHRSDKNLTLYRKLGYTECRRERVSSRLEIIFLEKANQSLQAPLP